MEALAIRKKFAENNLSILSSPNADRLFTKVELRPGIEIFDFSEKELEQKLEALLARLDKTLN